MANVNVDAYTDNYKLPLPNARNFLQDDVERLIRSFWILDAESAMVDPTSLQLLEKHIPDSVARLTGKVLRTDMIPDSVVQIGADGKIPLNKLPAAAVAKTHDASNQAAMLLLPANVGDFCRRLDTGKIYELVVTPATSMNNWREQALTVVTSVNGQAGDVTDVATKDDLDKRAGGYISQVFWHHNRAVLPDGCIAGDGQLLSRGTNAALFDLVQRKQVPVCSDADWLADPSKRGCYTEGDGVATFRVPDYNGAYSDGKSVIAPFMRGDGGAASNNGIAQPGAVPNLKGAFQGRNYGRLNTPALMNALDVFPGGSQSETQSGPFTYASYIGDTWANVGDFTDLSAVPAQRNPNAVITFDASTASSVYSDGINEVRPNALIGCYVIRFMGGAVVNAPLDASTLATRIEQVNTDLMNYRKTVTAIDNQVGYALVDFGTISINQQYTQPNPFGPNTPVILYPEVYYQAMGKWIHSNWIYGADASNNVISHGISASYAEGTGIVISTGTRSLASNPIVGGSAFPFPDSQNLATPSRCRVHVWCVGSDLSAIKTTPLDIYRDGYTMTGEQAKQAGWIDYNPAIAADMRDSVTVTIYRNRIEVIGRLNATMSQQVPMYGVLKVLPGFTGVNKRQTPCCGTAAGLTNWIGGISQPTYKLGLQTVVSSQWNSLLGAGACYGGAPVNTNWIALVIHDVWYFT
ncbi:tail fiber protein [Salmonella enterica subsp. enterica serovar Saintpaul]|nr:tail fiber protein [Salmonella enterica subsp. enterica serovar Saintpaul]